MGPTFNGMLTEERRSAKSLLSGVQRGWLAVTLVLAGLLLANTLYLLANPLASAVLPGVAAVLPLAVDDPKLGGMRRDDEVEAVAVEITAKHEQSQGRKPVSVEKDNCGWDITSLKDGQVARYIEVKGRAGDGDVCLTENEWIKAQRFGTDYWVYIVTDWKSEPKLHMIQDPASKLTPKAEVSIVRYIVDDTDWKRVAVSP